MTLAGFRARLGLAAAVLVFAAAMAAANPAPAGADNPWIIVVSGPLLARPVVIDDWKDNYILLAQEDLRIPVSRASLEGRAFLEIDLFWSPAWAPGSLSIPRRGPAAINADGHGRFYPAVNGRPALVVLDGSTSANTPGRVLQLGADGEEVLTRHGVPLSLAKPSADGASVSWLIAGSASTGLAVIAGFGTWWLISRRRRAPGLPAAARPSRPLAIRLGTFLPARAA